MSEIKSISWSHDNSRWYVLTKDNILLEYWLQEGGNIDTRHFNKKWDLEAELRKDIEEASK